MNKKCENPYKSLYWSPMKDIMRISSTNVTNFANSIHRNLLHSSNRSHMQTHHLVHCVYRLPSRGNLMRTWCMRLHFVCICFFNQRRKLHVNIIAIKITSFYCIFCRLHEDVNFMNMRIKLQKTRSQNWDTFPHCSKIQYIRKYIGMIWCVYVCVCVCVCVCV